jgi:hypothetical protein
LILLIAVNVDGASIESYGQQCGKNIDDVYKKAVDHAKGEAVEQLGISVNSKTVTFNSKLVRHIVSLTATAQVTNVETLKKDCAIKNNMVCCDVKLRLTVKEVTAKAADFGLSVVLNKSEYKNRDSLKITIGSSKSCYPYLYTVDEDNNVYRIFPNQFETQKPLKGTLAYPTQTMIDKGYTLQVYSEKPSMEELIFICTSEISDMLKTPIPEATAETPSEFTLQTNSGYKFKVEKLSEILINIEYGSYGIDSAMYQIVP